MKLNSIQLLRALAALFVVYTHSIGQMGMFAMGWQQRTPLRTSLGTFGVDIFFVISGFIIYLSAGQLTGRQASVSFLWHRFRRINPVYYVAVVLTVITWIPSFLRHQRAAPSTPQVASWIVLLPFPGNPPAALSQAWSLLYEWMFYWVFFLLILVSVRMKAAILCAVLGALAFLGWLFRDRLTGVWVFYTDPLLVEFGMGVVIGYIFRRWNPGKMAALCLLLPGIVAGLMILITGYGDFQAVLAPPAFLRYLHAFFWGSAAALIVAGCVFLEKCCAPAFFCHQNFVPDLRPVLVRKSRFAHFLLTLGDASYSIYLFHLIVFGFIGALYLRVGFFLPPDLAIPIHAAIAVAGSLLFYRFVEKPLLRWLKPR
ncbi:MAG TPA: acyltransferase [Puia sp.]|nr:acyltransferase [Puia sp.]